MSRMSRPPFEITPLADLARRHTEAAVKVLADVLEKGTDRNKLDAVEALLDRGWGKVSAAAPSPSPAQAVRDALDELPLEDLETLRDLMEMLKARRQGKAGGPE